MTTEWDAEKVRRAGLQPRHIAHLLGVTTGTARNWLHGNFKPHRLLRSTTDPFMRAIETALADDALPITAPGLMPEECSAATLAAVRRYLQDDRPTP
jgi:predicted transcriptional regulator